MPDKRTGELTPAEERACVLYCQGHEKTEATRLAFKRMPKDKQAQWNKASLLFQQPLVIMRIKALLDASKPQDIMSIGKWHRQVEVDIETARKAENHNAVMNGNRLLGQALGGLKDNVSLSVEQRTDDDEIIKALAKGDAAKAAQLKRILGAGDGFDA